LRRSLLVFLLGLFSVCILLPAVIVRGCAFYSSPRVVDPGPAGPFVLLRLASTGTVLRLPLEQYVMGVVAAEMPASFELEALRAQAVLARTYVVGRMRAFGGAGDPDHSEADISDDPARGQAWLDEAALRARWGVLSYAAYWRRIEQAVAGTAGIVATYGGELIEAAYHSTCGGQTESSGAVWQSSLPYLAPVACGRCGHSPRFQQTTTLTWREVETKLGPAAGALAVAASGGRTQLITVLSKTPGGRAAEVRVGDARVTGVALRAALGLPSASFAVRETAAGAVFTTRGFGHGVGMCQYGADGHAKAGLTYDQILSHYLPGVSLRQIFAR
jgi:stage II sporulation protein D